MGLFSIPKKPNNSSNKQKESLTEMVDKVFDDMNLRNELRTYLKSRREVKNVPSKKSWKVQLELLEKVPEQNRIAQVHNATIRGWRAVAFSNTYSKSSNKSYNSGVTRKKQEVSNIVAQCF